MVTKKLILLRRPRSALLDHTSNRYGLFWMVNSSVRALGKRLVVGFSLFVALAPVPSFADITYCNSEGLNKVIYLSPRIDAEDAEIFRYQQALQSQIKELVVGDRLTLYAATEAGVVKRFESCLPGCPPQDIWGQFLGLGGSCAATKAKAAKQVFARQYVSAARDIMAPSFQGSNDVLLTLAAVSKHLNNSEGNKNDVVIISSMTKTESLSEQLLDAWFVEAVQTDEIPDAFPKARISGLAVNAPLINFWQDIYSLKNQIFDYF